MPEWTTLKRMIWLLLLRGASAVIRTVTGTSPLVLENAVAAAIKSLKQYGKCTQSTTPTPSAPVDIVCNNGAIKYGALGANLLDPSAANTVLKYYINKADGEVKPSPPNFMFAGYMPVTPGTTYVAYGRAKTGNDLSDYNRVAWYDSTKTWISGANYTQNQIAVVTAPENAAYARFSCNPSGTTTQTVTQEYVDSFNWTFCEGTAEITPFVPFVGGIYTDGTPEVLTVSGKNEANVEDYLLSFTNRYYVDKAIGVTLEAGVTYTFSCDIECSITPFGISVGVGNDVVYLVDIVTKPKQTNGRIFVTFTPSTAALSNYSKLYVRIPRFTEAKTGTVSVSKIQLERSSSATDYEPYVTPQTVTDIPMLLSVNDYKDESEIISGLLTHKVGIKVLDGTESWALSDSGSTHRFRGTKPSDCHTPASRAPSVCTHFKYVSTGSAVGGMFIGASQYWYFIPTDQTIDTVDKWTAWVAGQYAAGTPVIVLYPLATEQTEQTTAHALHTSNGDNVVDVVSNVDPVELEVEYSASE